MRGCPLSAVKSKGQRGAREITLLVRQRRARELIKPIWLHRARKHREISCREWGSLLPPVCFEGSQKAKRQLKKFPCKEE